MTKTVGRRILTKDVMDTLLTEVEGCLNTRPLTYQETEMEDTFNALRPIDFIQRDIEITLPENEEPDDLDSTYLPSTERARLQTRLQAQKALRSSQMLTEKYWAIWQNHYLTALREQHRQYVDGRQGQCTCAPKPLGKEKLSC
ncbi:hypothetical protein V3C99_004828 [Haemonchus contortus]